MKNALAKIGIVSLLSLSGCSLLDNGIEAFGNVSLADKSTGLGDDTTWFYYNDELYFYVKQASKNHPDDSTYVAAMNGSGDYSYRFYESPSYPNLIWINVYSKINMVDYEAVYTKDAHIEIPADLLYDFPEIDDEWESGGNYTLNGKTYGCFGSVFYRFEIGEEAFIDSETIYYYVPNYEKWVACKNMDWESHAGYPVYELYYEIDVTSLPSDFVVAGDGLVEHLNF